jgi:hypothetical protein
LTRTAQGAQHVRKISRKKGGLRQAAYRAGNHKETKTMKFSNVPKGTKAVLFATLLLATVLSANSANAQSAFNGKFTLAEKAYWGHGVIPAGDYELSIPSTALPSMVVVREAATGKIIATLFPQIRESSTAGESELLIGTRGKQRVIYSIRLPEIGMVFISDPYFQRREQQEVRDTQAVPVVVAAK